MVTKRSIPRVILILILALLLPAGLSKGVIQNIYAQDETVQTEKANYLSDSEYNNLGLTLSDPAAFESSDTSNPLEGFTPSVLSELYIGQMNRDDNEEDYEGSFFIAENASTASADALNLNNMAKTTIGGVQGYYDHSEDSDLYTQAKKVVALKPGNLSDPETVKNKDIIIENTLYCMDDGAFREDDSYQGLMAWSLDNNNRYVGSSRWTKKLSGDHWVGQIEVSEQNGYTAMCVGDFDGDNYNEIAVYSPQEGGGKILFFQPNQKSNYDLVEESYNINLKDIDSHFNCTDNGRERPLVNLTTTSMSGQDDLVINVTLPFADGKYSHDGALSIQSYDNGAMTQTFYSNLEQGDGSRFNFNAAVAADINGDYVDELVVTGNKNYDYKAGDSKGKLSGSENLVQVVLWDEDNGYHFAWNTAKSLRSNEYVYTGKEYAEPQTLAAGRYLAGNKKDVIFCEGVYYHFTAGAGETLTETISSGTFISNPKEDFHFASGWETILNDNGKSYAMAYEPFISDAVSACFVEDSRSTEQLVIASGTDSRNTFSNSDMVDVDVAWAYGVDGAMHEECTNELYINTQDEDDNGTLLALCALNVDDDSVYLRYDSKTVGWSDPAVYSVMLSTPYWKDLDYGSAMNARGTTSFSASVTTTDSYSNSGNLGLTLGVGVEGGFKTALGGGGLGLGIDTTGSYVHSYQEANTRTDTITFTSGGGEDYVALVATPIACYTYKVFVPAHSAIQSDVDHGIAANVGDPVAAAEDEMTVSIQLNPSHSTVPVSTYNKVVEEYNRTNTDPDYTLSPIDLSAIYTARQAGDPSSYAKDILEISSLDSEADTTMVSDNWASINLNDKSTTALGISTSESQTSGDGYSANIKVASKEVVGVGFNFFGLFGAGMKVNFNQAISGGWGQTWSSTHASGMSYTGTFANLPASAQTGTSPAGVPESAYGFSTSLVKWEPTLDGVNGTINVVDTDGVSSKLTHTVKVLGYLVEGADNAPPALPEAIRVAATTENVALLAWQNVSMSERQAASYTVYYSKSEAGPYQQVTKNGQPLVVEGNASGCLVTGLTPNTDYYFKLQAHSSAGATGRTSVQSAYAKGHTKGSGFAPIITVPPVDVYTSVGNTADFSIEAMPQTEGDTLSYQWQQLTLKDNYKSVWTDVNGQTQTTFNAAYYAEDGKVNTANASDLDGTIYRCVVTEHRGNDYAVINSRSATLHIGEGHHTDLSLAIPADQASVVSEGEDNRDVTALSKSAINVSGQLVAEQVGLANQSVRVHIVDAQGIVQTHNIDSTTLDDGSYGATIMDGLEPGNYTLVATYIPLNSDTKATWSQPVDMTVLDSTQSYEITYELNGGNNAYNNPSTYTAASGTIKLEDPSRDGYTFAGWYWDAEKTKPVVDGALDCATLATQTGNLTLYANWKPVTYTITYELDGGTNASTNPSSYNTGDSVTLAEPTRDGFEFMGWYTDAEHTKKTTEISGGTIGDQIFYAEWKEDPLPAPPVPPVNPDEQGKYPISNYDELVKVAQFIQDDPEHFAGASYYLTNNILCDGKNWSVSIGSDNTPFTGLFDGRDYYIRGLIAEDGVAGLFGTIGNIGTVSNLSVIDFDWQAEGDIVGGLAGTNHGTISGCGSGVHFNSGGSYIDANGNTVPLSSLDSNVLGKVAGGLVGYNDGTITDSRSNATVTGAITGGLVGKNSGTITNVFNTGVVTGNEAAGGIIGRNTTDGRLIHGYNSKTVAGNGTLGAVVGESDTTNITGIYYSDAMDHACGNQDNTALGVTAMPENQMRSQTFCDTLNMDIEGTDLRTWTWKSSENNGYPRISKSVVVDKTVTNLETGITVSGAMHPDAKLKIIRPCTGNVDFAKLKEATKNKTLKDEFGLWLVYPDGTTASYEGQLTIQFKFDGILGNNVHMVQANDGQIWHHTTYVKSGVGTIVTSDLGLFAMVLDKDSSPIPNSPLSNIGNRQNVATGLTVSPWTGMITAIILISAGIFIAVGMMIQKGRNRVRK